MKTLFLISFLSFFGNNPSGDGIAYRQLSWSDFQGSIPADQPTAAALTATQMEIESTEDNGIFTYEVKATFLPSASFVRVRTEEVLRHEQTHFKIAYIASLRCMQELVLLQGKNWKAAKEVEAIYQRTCEERDRINNQFDLETNHSINRVAEEEWERNISKQLKQLVNGRIR